MSELEHVKCATPDLAVENAAKLIKLFPEVEGERGTVDLDKLRQVLSSQVIEGNVERYQFTRPGKRKAMAVASADPGVEGPSVIASQGASSLPGFETLEQGSFDLGVDKPDVGYMNAAIALSAADLKKNLHAVQDRQNLEHTARGAFGERGLPELEVEMETGTGKTFVYIKTIFELNKRYGWSKFIIVVPGIAIREGVKKSLDIMADKFLNDYGKTAKAFVYNSAHPGEG